jgi:hypothetical protein
VAALLCGVLGIGLGVVVAYAVQPRPRYGDLTTPLAAVSPSVPTNLPTESPPPPDINYPALPRDLPMPVVHTIHSRLATWTYHVPQGWLASSSESDATLTPRQIARSQDVRFRPAGEPAVGGYSLYVRTLDNVLDNVGQMVATKITGFEQAGYPDVHILKQNDSAVYFTYRDPSTQYLRYNFFQWFAVPGQQNATLQVSVAGRERDAPGLRNLIHRFADNVAGAVTPRKPPPSPASPTDSTSPSPTDSTSATP